MNCVGGCDSATMTICRSIQ